MYRASHFERASRPHIGAFPPSPRYVPKIPNHCIPSLTPIQLRCVGGSGKGLYEIDVMRCKNEGFDYNEEDVQWKCQASLPEEFKLGSTDVICEGYDSADDPYVLKGSCGVEYRLVLTSKGQEKYGHRKGWFGDDESDDGPSAFGQKVASALFWMVFIGMACWIVYNAFIARALGRAPLGGTGNRPGWGGGGGGGGWGGNDNDDPPPPYDYHPSPGQNPKRSYGTSEGWRPGFWSGALGGAAATYAAGLAGNRNNRTSSGWGMGNSRWGGGYDNGEGSSRGSSSSPSYSTTRHESTGFGSTSRR
jgi:hypothetical protein